SRYPAGFARRPNWSHPCERLVAPCAGTAQQTAFMRLSSAHRGKQNPSPAHVPFRDRPPRLFGFGASPPSAVAFGGRPVPVSGWVTGQAKRPPPRVGETAARCAGLAPGALTHRDQEDRAIWFCCPAGGAILLTLVEGPGRGSGPEAISF